MCCGVSFIQQREGEREREGGGRKRGAIKAVKCFILDLLILYLLTLSSGIMSMWPSRKNKISNAGAGFCGSNTPSHG